MGAATCFSITIKRKRKASPRSRLPATRELLQPAVADSKIPYTSPASPRVTVKAPSQSIFRASDLRDSGTCRKEIQITAAASGTLMKKTQCHEACSTSHPPITGPIAAVIDVNPDHVPIARPRDSSSKDALIIARLLGTSAAAPIP